MNKKEKKQRYEELIKTGPLDFLAEEGAKPDLWSEDPMRTLIGQATEYFYFYYTHPGFNEYNPDDHPDYSAWKVRFESKEDYSAVLSSLEDQNDIPKNTMVPFPLIGLPQEPSVEGDPWAKDSLDLHTFEAFDDIRAAEFDFAWPFIATPDSVTCKVTLTYPGGKDDRTVYWLEKYGIWGCFWRFPADNRYYNSFGTTKPEPGKQLKITAELNIPTVGINAKMQGAFAKDAETGNRWMIHRGKGLKPKAGKPDFGKFFDCRWETLNEKGKKKEVLVIGCVGEQKLVERVANFVKAVGKFKQA